MLQTYEIRLTASFHRIDYTLPSWSFDVLGHSVWRHGLADRFLAVARPVRAAGIRRPQLVPASVREPETLRDQSV